MNDTVREASAVERRWYPLALLVVVGLGVTLVAMTWGRWGDAVIDLGRELEVAWKVSAGKLLYRDVAYNYGPLSPYVNAAFVRVFGANVTAFVWSGLLSTVLASVLIYSLARRFVTPLAALAVLPVFFCECAFQHYYWNGTFNFVLPYSFPAVHGIVCALAAVWAAFRALDSGRTTWLVAAGACTGLSALCKLEIALAVFVALGALSVVFGQRVWREPVAALRHLGGWGIPAALVTTIGFAPFILGSSYDQVVARNVIRTDLVDVRSNVFFTRLLGLEDVAASMEKIGWSLLFWGIALAVAWGLARVAVLRGLVGAAVCAVLAGAAWFVPIRYDALYRALPVVALVMALSAVGRAPRDRATAMRGVLGVFALAALGRMLFNAGGQQYGFFLAIPGFVAFAVFMAGIAPGWLRVPATGRALFVGLLLSVMAVRSAQHFVTRSWPKYEKKTLALEGPRGRLAAHPFRPRYKALEGVLKFLAEKSKAGETLLVLPEGAAINFLANRTNPTSFNLFTPPELNAPGVEDQLIREIEREQIDWILIVDRKVEEFGYRGPGIDYALKLWPWLMRRYDMAARFGPAPPFARPDVEGGAFLVRRKAR